MGKFTLPILLIVLGGAILSYSKMSSVEADDNKGWNLIGGTLVTIGGLMTIWRSSQSK